jgi:2-polyprenyl-6-hydroxyphenyl methylase/3-demethylubiquinone-9 3-methyltransferase
MFHEEVDRGDRFQFGANWARFLAVLDDDRIALAESSLKHLLSVDDLRSLRFLDAGSGSGLFSLAARRLGATVHSFDYDPDSVQCTQQLRERFRPSDPGWSVDRGSLLDRDYLARLGQFDVVYSWGVVHHTGAMWQALENVAPLVAPNGKLFISIYNDQGNKSRRWAFVKRTYNGLPRPLKIPFALSVMGPREVLALAKATLRGRPWEHIEYIAQYSQRSLRGMSYWHDLLDWVGGYPFEVAKPERVFEFFRDRGFRLAALTTVGAGHGCNEFVFERGS